MKGSRKKRGKGNYAGDALLCLHCRTHAADAHPACKSIQTTSPPAAYLKNGEITREQLCLPDALYTFDLAVWSLERILTKNHSNSLLTRCRICILF